LIVKVCSVCQSEFKHDHEHVCLVQIDNPDDTAKLPPTDTAAGKSLVDTARSQDGKHPVFFQQKPQSSRQSFPATPIHALVPSERHIYRPQWGGAADETLAPEVETVDEVEEARFHVEKHQDPNLGTALCGRYRIVSIVGRGGMGVVYKAEHETIDRLVAIKMLHPHVVADAENIKRFHAEAKAVSRVEHQHSVRIYDFGISDSGQPFIVMDYIEGGSLRELIANLGTVPLARCADIFGQAVAALSCAHSNGIIHRDLKPENIMLGRKDNADWVSVVDFGISLLSQDDRRPGNSVGQVGEIRGSPAYMSPEQCSRGVTVDQRSDIYSMGIVLYEALSGKLPYLARNPFELIDAHINVQPVPFKQADPALAACEALTAVLSRAMEKQPDRRQQSMEEFGSEIAEAVKRDAIRLNYLKHRKDVLTSQQNIPTFTDEELKSLTAGVPLQSKQSPTQKLDDSWVDSVVQFMSGRHARLDVEPDEPDVKYLFTNCPRCNEPVDAGISFCLECGRSLATTREFAKIRSVSGVFQLPKGDPISSSTQPIFSRRSKSGPSAIAKLFRQTFFVSSVLGAIWVAVWVSGGMKTVTATFNHLIQNFQ
jgi:serine/threonine protein kinase